MSSRTLFPIFVASAFLISMAGTSFGAPAYGTRIPDRGHAIHGLQFNSFCGKSLEGPDGSVRSSQGFLMLSYGLADRLSLDLKIGAGDVRQIRPGSNELKYRSGFAGGYGLRFKFLDYWNGDMDMVMGLQHISVHPRKEIFEGEKNRAILSDWQLSLIASGSFKKFRPYAGLKMSKIEYLHWAGEDESRKKSESNWVSGIILGLDMPFFFDSWLNIETSLVREKSFSLAIMQKF